MRTTGFFAVISLLLFLTSCSGGEEGSTLYACSYEERSTDGCDGMGFGAWAASCYEFDKDNYTISAQEVCGNVTEAGLFCEAGCCIDYEYRNVLLQKGHCP